MSRSDHPIGRSLISDPALKVLNRLSSAGHRACIVGGGVRDLLLGVTPKDFDVATDASPEEVRALFSNARLIGRRFRLAHVRFGREIIEVSTFRANLGADQDSGKEDEGDDGDRRFHASGRILRDNVFGSIEEDALRRDFTVNALYYDIADRAIYDYVGGMADVQARRLRLIGDAERRYREDPVRCLRAVRIATKLGLDIEADTAAPIRALAPLLADVPPARLFDEALKLLMAPEAPAVFAPLRDYRLFDALFPDAGAALDAAADVGGLTLIGQALSNTAERIRQHRPVTPAFLFAALLWPAVRRSTQARVDQGLQAYPAQMAAQREVIERQVQRVAIPRRFSVPMREIWQLQPRFHRQRGKAPARLMAHPRFRAAYDFLLLRAQAGEESADLARWWTEIQEEHQAPVEPRRRRGRRAGRNRSRAGRSSS
ncbi:MAG: polynucleotide adenylyltransferase PcnB [Salinisphaera sp.]|nr:polynucleotide adenylyltransferase PcnB [Salinisphaera sp.]